MLLRNRLTGRLLAVMVSHNKSGKEVGEDGYIKMAQAERLVEILEGELGPTIPILYGCDFNNGTETESYQILRKGASFMGEAYQEIYGRAPKWTCTKWRNAGGQPHKVGVTPNNIDFMFYNKRFFKPLAVLGYPDEELEVCSMPGYRYPSDHFAHFAVYQERDLGEGEVDDPNQKIQDEKLYKSQQDALDDHNERGERMEEHDKLYKTYVVLKTMMSETSTKTTLMKYPLATIESITVEKILDFKTAKAKQYTKEGQDLTQTVLAIYPEKSELAANLVEARLLCVKNLFKKGSRVYTEDGRKGTIFSIQPANEALWLDFADGTRDNKYPMAKVRLESKTRRLGEVNTKVMSPSELVLHRRRLADAARMEEKDMDAMSPSQLALHRRRLTHGARVSPVLAALMDEIEQAQRNY